MANKVSGTVRQQKYLTKSPLIAVAAEGDRLNFNRQIDPKILDKVTDERMPVTFCMRHEHAGGELVAAHAPDRIRDYESVGFAQNAPTIPK